MNERYLAVIVVFATVVFGLWHGLQKSDTHPLHPPRYAKRAVTKPQAPQRSTEAEYIYDVVVHGSSRLHFKPTETMPEGLATGEDARNVTHYVLSLRNAPYDASRAAKGAAIYSGNCAGCHGDDGKGIHGTYPDLTRKVLLGMER